MSKFIQYITGATLAMGLVLSGGSAMAHGSSYYGKATRLESSRCDFRRDFRRDFRGGCSGGFSGDFRGGSRAAVVVVVNSGLGLGSRRLDRGILDRGILDRGILDRGILDRGILGGSAGVVVAVNTGRDRLGCGDLVGSRCGEGREFRRFDRGFFRIGRRGCN